MQEQLNIFDTNDKKRAKAKQYFEKNYRHLIKNASGAWFSFGDEKLIKATITKLAQTPHGQNIIANLPPDLELESSHFVSSHLFGYFDKEIEKIALNTHLFNDKNALPLISHELLHASQAHLGVFDVKGFAPVQVAVVGLVAEAEAEGWDRMYEVLQAGFGSYTPTKASLAKFLKTDYIALAKEKLGPDFNEKMVKQTSPLYRFQQLLKKYNGNMVQAQKDFVGSEMKACMSAYPSLDNRNGEWKLRYNNQSISFMLSAMEKGYLTKKGNTPAFLSYLEKTAKKYNLKKEDLAQLNISTKEEEIFLLAHKAGVENAYQTAENNQKRNWQQVKEVSSDVLTPVQNAFKNLYR